MAGGFDENIERHKQVIELPPYVGVEPSEFELMLNHRLFWYMLGLIIYLIITLILYVIFRARKYEHPLKDALKISWIWGIIIVFVLYNVYMIFVGTCNMCEGDPIFNLMLLDVGFIIFIVIALIFYFEEIKDKKNTINNKTEQF